VTVSSVLTKYCLGEHGVGSEKKGQHGKHACLDETELCRSKKGGEFLLDDRVRRVVLEGIRVRLQISNSKQQVSN
jgi:hypothetical protein